MKAIALKLWTRIRRGNGAESQCASIPSGVIARIDDAGMVLFCTRLGLIYRVNHVGALIWTSVLQGHRRESLAAIISERFGIEATDASNHIETLVSSLVEKRLLRHPEYPHA